MNFVKTFFAALLAVVVGFGLVVMLWTLVLVGLVASFGSSPTAMVPGSVLRLDLGVVADSPVRSPLEGIDPSTLSLERRTPLLKTIRAIHAAAADDRVEGIYLNFDESVSASLASLEEIRAELVRFRESGKFIVAYQEEWSQIAYWFSSVADSVYTNPLGGVQLTGMSASVMFYKGLLDKLDIEPVVVRHGEFKSAIEPFVLDKMSPANRTQYEKLIGSIWAMITSDIAGSRSIDASDIDRWADNLAIDSPSAALEKGLIDGIRYEDEVLATIAALTSVDEGDGEPRIVSLSDYLPYVSEPDLSSRNKVAVIYAEGTIVSGAGAADMVGSVSMVEKIERARRDPDTKAVVLRINSPGGSALASEVMWRELELLRAEKPLVVSMGATAASGGYYIAAPADAIYANRSTITGSIGVFGLLFNASGALEGKLGITTDVVKTGKYSDMGSVFRAPAKAETDYLQNSVEQIYAAFVEHVSDGRNMTPDAVDAIGQGRVWSGADALETGLIDGHGGLTDALSLAADRVGISDDFRVWEIVDPVSPLAALMGALSTCVGKALSASVGKAITNPVSIPGGEIIHRYEYLQKMQGVQALMPFIVDIH